MTNENRNILETLLADKTNSQLKNLILDLVSRFPDSYSFVIRWEQSKGKIDVSAELAMQLWEKAETIISEFNEYGGGPEDEEDKANEYIEELCKLLPSLSWDVRQEIMDGMLVQYRYGNSGFDDVLTDTCFKMCKEEHEWRYLANKFMSFGGRWNKERAMEIYSEIGADDEYLNIRQSSLEYGSDYLDLAWYYEEQGDTEKALALAHTGLKKAGGSLSGLVGYLFDYYEEKRETAMLEEIRNFCDTNKTELRTVYDRLYNYYKSEDNYEAAKKYILLKYDIYGGHELNKLYTDTKEYLTKEDWDKHEPGLFALLKERDTTSYLNICLEKGLKQEVLDFVTGKKAPYSFSYVSYDTFADKLADDYPHEIIKYYRDKAFKLAEAGAGRDRENYKEAMRHLAKVKQIYTNILNDTSVWQSLLAEFRTKYQKRPALLEESKVLD